MTSASTIIDTASLRYTPDQGWSADFPPLDSPSTLVVVFAGPKHMDNPDALKQLAEAYRSSVIVGCSTAGEIFGAEVDDGSLTVAVKRFRHSRLCVAYAPVRGSEDSFNAGAELARQIEGPGLRLALVYSDGLNVNGSELVAGFSSVASPGVVVTGGLAGDGTDFKRTWVLRNGVPTSCMIAAVGLYGDRLRVGHGCMGGWDVFGPTRRVTRAIHSKLYTLDGEPALPLYKQYLGERSSGLPGTALLFPLEMRLTSTDDEHLVRTILAVDEAEGSMTFAGDIPEGSYVRLMHANTDRLVMAAGRSGSSAAGADTDAQGRLIIAVSCVGRRLVLGERTEEELESVAETLREGDHLVGFYSYGEISPLASGKCELHNQTMTITMVGEV